MTPPLLQAIGVEMRYRGTTAPSLTEANVTVDFGDAIAVVGESGSGKTTLARSLAGALRPTGGEVLIKGRRWDQVSRRDDARRRVQMIFQDPVGALTPWMSARESVAEVIRHWRKVKRTVADDAADELLWDMGLAPEAAHRRPTQLSGGQCQRVGIARALAADPDVLIADEPTASLDVSVQAQILNLLARLQRERRLAVVLISHDLEVVRYLTTDAIVMYRGRIVERGRTPELMGNPHHPYTSLLLHAQDADHGDSVGHPRDQTLDNHPCVFAHRCRRLQEDCSTVLVDPGATASIVCKHALGRFSTAASRTTSPTATSCSAVESR